jgi:hypothetical protein
MWDGPDPKGPEILDDLGRPVWFHKVPEGEVAADFRVQTYNGKPVLTWWQGKSADGIGQGAGYIADTNYRVIAKVSASDLHEFELTPQGTALVTNYEAIPYDLSQVGGPKKGTILDSVVEEVDVATGRVLMRWNSLKHVPVADSGIPTKPTDSKPYDYFHINSVVLHTDGNLLISGRGTSTVYKLDRRTGRIIWRLGGTHSTFRLGTGARFTWQHDASVVGKNKLRIFDNHANTDDPGAASRVVWIRTDPKRRTAELEREIIHPERLSALSQGNSQALPNGNSLVGWGPTSRISEFSRNGKLVYDAALPPGWTTYRAFRFPWKGRPTAPPTVRVEGGTTVHAVWNGATGVARWRLLLGASEAGLRPVGEVLWNGLDTAIPVPAPQHGEMRHVKVEALDTDGRVMGRSATQPSGR